MNNRKIKIYWVFKIVFKIIFSYLPISYTYWKKLGIFVHGEMDSPEYAENIFLEHFNFCVKSNSITVLEVGPGDSLFTCMIAKSFNVEKYYYVDKSKYVSRLVVSTEDKIIKKMCLENGVEVIDRPIILSKDDVEKMDVITIKGY